MLNLFHLKKEEEEEDDACSMPADFYDSDRFSSPSPPPGFYARHGIDSLHQFAEIACLKSKLISLQSRFSQQAALSPPPGILNPFASFPGPLPSYSPPPQEEAMDLRVFAKKEVVERRDSVGSVGSVDSDRLVFE